MRDSNLQMESIYQQEIGRLKHELRASRAETQAAYNDCETRLSEARIGNGKIVHALDTAIQLVEALIMFLPEGMILPDGVKTAKGALDHALRELRK
jgi:hypothetical protein